MLKDLFQNDHPALLDLLTGGVAVRQSLNVEFAMVVEKRLDLLFLLETDTLFHLDFQSGNLFSMPYRVGVYSLMASHDLRKRIYSVVLYTGHEKLSMKDHVDTGDVLALLARGGAGKLRRILEKLGKLPGPQRDRALAQLAVLSGLRRMSGRFTMELKSMGITIDIDKHVFLREIRDAGKAEGMHSLVRRLLKTKFGELPTWAASRIETGSTRDIKSWADRLLNADSLQAVNGKR